MKLSEKVPRQETEETRLARLARRLSFAKTSSDYPTRSRASEIRVSFAKASSTSMVDG